MAPTALTIEIAQSPIFETTVATPSLLGLPIELRLNIFRCLLVPDGACIHIAA